MKHFRLALSALVALTLLSGCSQVSKNYAEVQRQEEAERLRNREASIVGQASKQQVVVEGCTYIYIFHDRSMTLTHKGNCPNPIHQGGK